jgi:hypothetical protein
VGDVIEELIGWQQRGTNKEWRRDGKRDKRLGLNKGWKRDCCAGSAACCDDFLKKVSSLRPAVIARLESMTVEQMDEVGLKLLTAQSLEELGLEEDRPA